jgi:hypothetical protein
MTEEERVYAMNMAKLAGGIEYALRRQLQFTKSKRKRLALAEQLVAVIGDRERCEAVLRG